MGEKGLLRLEETNEARLSVIVQLVLIPKFLIANLFQLMVTMSSIDAPALFSSG